MENQRQNPEGGERTPAEANSYGTDDPETQAHIENARIDAARDRQQARARLERLIELGLNTEDAQSFIEFEDTITGQRSNREEATPWPQHDTD